MKTPLLPAILLMLAAACVSKAQEPAPVLVERGPHHYTLGRVHEVRTPRGVRYQTNASLVVLEPGVHRWDAAHGWVPASPRIEPFRDGAVVRGLQTRIAVRNALRIETQLELNFGGANLSGRLTQWEVAAKTATQGELNFLPYVERQTLARDFYRQAGWKAADIPSHLKGIDFNHPVEVVVIPKGTVLMQHQLLEMQNGQLIKLTGNYFGELGTPASGMGIYSGGSRAAGSFIATEDVMALKSTAARAVDTWTVKPFGSFPVQTTGGSGQYFVPNKSGFAPMN